MQLPDFMVEEVAGFRLTKVRYMIIPVALVMCAIFVPIALFANNTPFHPDVRGYHRALHRVEGACGHRAAHYWHQSFNVDGDFDGAAEDWIKRCLTGTRGS